MGVVTVTAYLSAVISQDVTVPYSVTGTAQGGGTDHDLADGIMTITAGSTIGTLLVNVTDDTLDESSFQLWELDNGSWMDTTGLVGYWKANETGANLAPGGLDTEDFSGSGNHATEFGGMSSWYRGYS